MSQGTWLQCSINGVKPAARYGSASCLLGEYLYLYGGAVMQEGGANHYFGDLFMMALNGEQVVSKLVQAGGVNPGPRVGGTLLHSGGYLYLFGGTRNEFTLEHCTGVYKLHISSHTWYQVETKDDPCVVSYSMSVHNTTLYMFGGVQGEDTSNNLYTLSITEQELQWKLTETSGTAPSPRVDHCSAIQGDKMLVFGGSGSHNLWYNDLHVLHLPSLTWSSLSCSNNPPPCDFSTLTSYSREYVVLFGGSNDSLPGEVFNKVWYYSTSTNSWYTCNVLGSPPCDRYVHSTVVLNDLVYVFGGLDADSTSLSDMWVLQLHNMEGRVVPDCGIENPPPPVTEFQIQKTLPVAPELNNFDLPDIARHTGLDNLKESVICQVRKGFEVLEAEYAVLYHEKETLAKEKVLVERTRRLQEDWVKEQRDDLIRQCDEHTDRCKDWAALQTLQFGEERKILMVERKGLVRAQNQLAAQQSTLNRRIRKIEELMAKANPNNT